MYTAATQAQQSTLVDSVHQMQCIHN